MLQRLWRGYLGNRTGENVLSGGMYRGSQDTLDAGIMFSDVRGLPQCQNDLGLASFES